MTVRDSKVAIVQVAGGFRCRPQHPSHYQALSAIDRARGEKVVALYRPGNHVFVTGMVPYETKLPECTLANLSSELLVRSGIPALMIVPIAGLSPFSISSNVCARARRRGLEKIVVVASDFYFLAYERMWRAAARRNGLAVEIVTLNHGDEVSAAVWNFHDSYPVVLWSHLAAISVFGHALAQLVADWQMKRRTRTGYQYDGHTVIG
jgi:hypothetical protein